jgi:murein DD-endopeptidase MepM/ murein hydrolase activator NlpD
MEEPVDSKYHFGIDLATTEKANVYASNTGSVSYVNGDGVGIYGKLVIVNHGLGFYSLYSHLSTISVKVGEKVNKKTVIGKTGQTGYAQGDHLHFGIYIQGVPFDPIELFDKNYINLKIINIYNQFIARTIQ